MKSSFVVFVTATIFVLDLDHAPERFCQQFHLRIKMRPARGWDLMHWRIIQIFKRWKWNKTFLCGNKLFKIYVYYLKGLLNLRYWKIEHWNSSHKNFNLYQQTSRVSFILRQVSIFCLLYAELMFMNITCAFSMHFRCTSKRTREEKDFPPDFLDDLLHVGHWTPFLHSLSRQFPSVLIINSKTSVWSFNQIFWIN